jgi:hypothetical protein
MQTWSHIGSWSSRSVVTLKVVNSGMSLVRKMMQPILCPSWGHLEKQFRLAYLEHLRKPSIKPSLESTSIFVPAGPEAVPMEVDAGASTDNPGTPSDVPGNGPTLVVTAVFKGKGKMYLEVDPAYPRNAPAYLGTALSVRGTS